MLPQLFETLYIYIYTYHTVYIFTFLIPLPHWWVSQHKPGEPSIGHGRWRPINCWWFVGGWCRWHCFALVIHMVNLWWFNKISGSFFLSSWGVANYSLMEIVDGYRILNVYSTMGNTSGMTIRKPRSFEMGLCKFDTSRIDVDWWFQSFLTVSEAKKHTMIHLSLYRFPPWYEHTTLI